MRTAILSRNAELDMLTQMLNGGYLRIYSGDQPAGPESPAAGVLLATLRFSDPAYDPAKEGVASARAIAPDTNAASTGKATWFRCFKADGTTPVFDGSVGRASADLVMNAVEIQAHSLVSVSSLPISMPQ